MYPWFPGPILPANKPPFTRNNDYANSHHFKLASRVQSLGDSGDISPYCLVTKGSLIMALYNPLIAGDFFFTSCMKKNKQADLLIQGSFIKLILL